MSIYKATYRRNGSDEMVNLYFGVDHVINGEDSLQTARQLLPQMGGVLQGEDYHLVDVQSATEFSSLADIHMSVLHDDCALYEYEGCIVRTSCLLSGDQDELSYVLENRARCKSDASSWERFQIKLQSLFIEWDEWESLREYEQAARDAVYELMLSHITEPDALRLFSQQAITELRQCFAEHEQSWPDHWPLSN